MKRCRTSSTEISNQGSLSVRNVMKRHLSGALMAGAFVLAVSGCTEDPLATLRGGGPARVVLSASTLTVNVKDSVAVTATVVDEQGNPLTDAATATSNVPATVSVSSVSG